MPTLTVTRGLPGSGKTTGAKAWVDLDPRNRARINRDDLRTQLHGGVWLGPDTEQHIIAVRNAAISALLRRGVDVICDDTNLPQRTVRDLARIAASAGADLDVWDLTYVDVDECVRRDATRDKPVGEQVIRDMHRRYLAHTSYPLPLPDLAAEQSGHVPEPYMPPDGKPTAVMVDVDGTVALMAGRSPFDEGRVHEDQPNAPVIAVVRAMAAAGHRVVFCSGRTEACRPATAKWLAEHVAVPHDGLHMRPAGDKRQDAIVKLELFDRHIRHHYQVIAVLDDRAQVVAAWRAIGLTVLQVAEGNF